MKQENKVDPSADRNQPQNAPEEYPIHAVESPNMTEPLLPKKRTTKRRKWIKKALRKTGITALVKKAKKLGKKKDEKKRRRSVMKSLANAAEFGETTSWNDGLVPRHSSSTDSTDEESDDDGTTESPPPRDWKEWMQMAMDLLNVLFAMTCMVWLLGLVRALALITAVVLLGKTWNILRVLPQQFPRRTGSLRMVREFVADEVSNFLRGVGQTKYLWAFGAGYHLHTKKKQKRRITSTAGPISKES
mmetsp:Transcript_22403/g.51655  ORF Transcript_22403/g.51655 Transcript_22403/m.51655 type:complete len:246 (+) Transcript_22403:219-956(+)